MLQKPIEDCSMQELLDIIGWTPAVLADRLKINLRTAQRFASGQNETPPKVWGWLAVLAGTHRALSRPIGWEP